MTALPQSPAQLEAHLIALEDQGYDAHGGDRGNGHPLYWVTTEDGRIDCLVRADADKSDRAKPAEPLRPEERATDQGLINQAGPT